MIRDYATPRHPPKQVRIDLPMIYAVYESWGIIKGAEDKINILKNNMLRIIDEALSEPDLKVRYLYLLFNCSFLGNCKISTKEEGQQLVYAEQSGEIEEVMDILAKRYASVLKSYFQGIGNVTEPNKFM